MLITKQHKDLILKLQEGGIRPNQVYFNEYYHSSNSVIGKQLIADGTGQPWYTMDYLLTVVPQKTSNTLRGADPWDQCFVIYQDGDLDSYAGFGFNKTGIRKMLAGSRDPLLTMLRAIGALIDEKALELAEQRSLFDE